MYILTVVFLSLYRTIRQIYFWFLQKYSKKGILVQFSAPVLPLFDQNLFFSSHILDNLPEHTLWAFFIIKYNNWKNICFVFAKILQKKGILGPLKRLLGFPLERQT